jgi:hypothetical protein
MSKTFSHAGVSTFEGVTKVRFANDSLRVKHLAKVGHKDIDIVELKSPMTKEDAVAYLISIDFATQNGVTNETVQAALLAEVDKRSEKPAKAPKAAKPAKGAKAKPTLESIKAKATKAAPKAVVTKAEVESQLEDAPF